MAILRSSKKSLRKSERRRVLNLQRKIKIKILWKKFFNLLKERKIEEAKEEIKKLQKEIDKAVKRNLFKKNKASRMKSKIFKALNVIEKEKKG